MEFKWEPVAYGYRINAYVNSTKVSEILLWNDDNNNKKIRANWIQTEKKYQNKGHGKAILEEVKKSLKNIYPNVETLVFSQITSLGMLRLIKEVFEHIERHISSDLPKWRKAEILSEDINLPEKSPAKYDLSGNARISKNSRMIDFYYIFTS